MADGNAITTTETGKKVTIKDPQAVLDYSFVWTDWLLEIGDDISFATTSVSNPAGIANPMVIQSTTVFGGIVTIFVSGGQVGKTHVLNCRVTTTNTPPRTDERSLNIKIRDR